jgi:hypothetical protein
MSDLGSGEKGDGAGAAVVAVGEAQGPGVSEEAERVRAPAEAPNNAIPQIKRNLRHGVVCCEACGRHRSLSDCDGPSLMGEPARRRPESAENA